jgi:glycosyltransferase domain-containing protein
MITLLIPTYNRPSHLQRLLNYLETSGQSLSVLIADSSLQDQKNANMQVIQKSNYPGIEYVPYASEIRIETKICNALHRVKTPYVVMCADDDFIIPSAALLCADFLEKNADYTVAQGYYYSFSMKRLNNEPCFNWVPMYSSGTISLTADDPKERLAYVSSTYVHTFYAVHRTATLRTIFNLFEKGCTSDYSFSEIWLTFISMLYGKMQILPIPIGFREITCHNTGWLLESDYNEHLTLFVRHSALHASEKMSCTNEQAQEIMLRFWKRITAYQRAVTGIDKPQKPTGLLFESKQLLKKIIPSFIIDTLLNIKNKRVALKDELLRTSVKNRYACLTENPTSLYHQDFLAIKTQVLRSGLYSPDQSLYQT